MNNLWNDMTSIIEQNRGIQARNVDGSLGERRTRPSGFVDGEKRMHELSEKVLVVTGKMSLGIDEVKVYLDVMLHEIGERIASRTHRTHADVAPQWVVNLRMKRDTSAAERLTLGQWTSMAAYRAYQASLLAVDNSVAVIALRSHLARIESAIHDRDADAQPI
eukprot:1219390-Prymnesium_polylepis.1